jgi:valyl-tRNA synthetase
MPELEKNYAPAEVEARWYQRWLDERCFQADPSRVSEKRPAYSIVIPPPNVTGILTLGHVLNNTIQDILARRARMLGKEVLWLPGTDHAGIATQNAVEKMLRKEGAIKHRDDLGREGLVKKIWEWKDKYGGIILQQLRAIGASCDWSRTRFTLDEDYSRCVQEVFVDLYKKGLIYRGKRMVNWCPSALSAISDEEVVMKEQSSFMYHFQVEVVGATLTAQQLRPRSVDISAQQEQNAQNEYSYINPRTGLRSYIKGSPFDERAGAALASQNRRAMGSAARCMDGAQSGGKVGSNHSAFWEKFRTLLSSGGDIEGLPIVDLKALGLQASGKTISIIEGSGLTKLPPGAEAQPFADKTAGVVYKIFASDTDGYAGRLIKVDNSTGKTQFDFAVSNPLQMLEKIALLHEIGGLATEIVGVTIDGDWIVAQPLATAITQEELGKARAEAVAAVGGVMINEPGFEDIRLVWHRGQTWLIGDLHVRNIMRDHTGQARIMGALILPLPSQLEKDYATVRTAVHEAKLKAGVLSEEEQKDLFGSTNANKVFLAISTTRPETIPGDTAICVHPEDPRYAHLIGKHVRRPLPLENQALIPIVADSHVEKDFGTGVLKVTPAHDKADFEIGLRHGLEVLDVMQPNGIMNELAGKDLAGMERFAARKRAVELLQETGAFLKEEPYKNKVGYSERADVPIEPRLSEQWFLKYPSVEASQEVVASQKMRFFPDRWAKVYDHWMGGLQDWCISRQLWWGHRVPVWYHKNDPSNRLCQIDPPADAENWQQDSDVLDTWFSSWLWPFATMGWPSKTAELKAFYPTTDLVTGPDIIFFWVARMIMAGYEYMGEMPFKNVYFTGIIRDKLGRKMSKSLGNSPDPLELIAKFSADALRFGVMRSAPLGQDILFDEKNVELGRNFCTKLWNAARFRQMQNSKAEGVSDAATASVSDSFEAEINPTLLTLDDKWILLRLNAAILEVTTSLEEYRFSDATNALYRFFWTEYCDWYVETCKAALQSDHAARKANTLAVMDFVLSHTLRLFHPFIPFITEELWHGMGFNTDLPEDQGGKTIMTAPWPKPLDDDELAYFGILPEDEAAAQSRYDVVNLGRGLKSTFNVASNKRTRFVLKASTPLAEHEHEVLRILLNAEPLDLAEAYAAPKGTPVALTPLGELFLPLEGLIDVQAERERLSKELTKVETELGKVRAKLADTNFTSKVPQKVLDEHTQREADWAAQYAKIKAMAEALAG